MKQTILPILILFAAVFVWPACKHHEAGHAATYSCPMHPDVTGKGGDKCSKCGMDLEASTAYVCPMHPDITGKAGDKCSKCGMDLETSAAYVCPMHKDISGKAGDKCSKCGMDLKAKN